MIMVGAALIAGEKTASQESVMTNSFAGNGPRVCLDHVSVAALLLCDRRTISTVSGNSLASTISPISRLNFNCPRSTPHACRMDDKKSCHY
jgi:hypothetical protein